jgi:hypothetical protein
MAVRRQGSPRQVAIHKPSISFLKTHFRMSAISARWARPLDASTMWHRRSWVQLVGELNAGGEEAMWSLWQIFAIGAVFAGLAPAWAAEVPSAARTELHQIQTLTLSDQQFLKGDTSG